MAGNSDRSEDRTRVAVDELGVLVDRDAEVPIGVQMAWAIRARIGDGTLQRGGRLPGIRELADSAGVNVNTVRAVYQRLEQEGLIISRHGDGTFVSRDGAALNAAGRIASSAALKAAASGVDAREVAAALYVGAEPATQPELSRERRRELRMQIAALELTACELEAESPRPAPARVSTGPGDGPRLLGSQDLEAVRNQLVHRLTTIQSAIDRPMSKPDTQAKRDRAADAPAGTEAVRRSPTKRPNSRITPRPRTA